MIKLTKLWNVIFVSKNYAMGTSVMKNTFYLHFHTNRSIKKKLSREKKRTKKHNNDEEKNSQFFFTLKAQKKTQLGMDEPKFRRLFS